MGYGTRPGVLGHTIRTFWPDDTETEMYIEASTPVNLGELTAKIDEKWPGLDLSDCTIYSEHVHTDCLGYDIYDQNDYTDFLVITKVAK